MFKNKRNHVGLTLIELLAVLVILVAVAGTLVPLIPNVSRQSHGASGADAIKEITKALTLYQQLNGEFPNGFDSLIDGTDALLTSPNAPMVRTEVLDLSSAGAIEDAVRAALFSAGITTAYEHDFSAANQTFEGVTAVDALGISDESTATGAVAVLTEAGEGDLNLAESQLTNGSSDIVRYVAFGLGNQSGAIGQTMIDAPVMFSPDNNPNEAYVRYAVIFAVKESGSLELATVAGIHHMANMVMFAGLNHHLEEYFESSN